MAAAFPVNPLDPLAPEQLETLLSKYRPILELKPLKYDEVMVIQQHVYNFVHAGNQVGANIREFASMKENAGVSRIKMLKFGLESTVREKLVDTKKIICPPTFTALEVQLTDFLKRYSECWDKFQIVIKSADVFCAVNTAETGANSQKTQEFRRVVLDAWYGVIYEDIKDQLVRAVLYLLDREREGDNIEGKILEQYRISLERLSEQQAQNNTANSPQPQVEPVNERRNLCETYLVQPVLKQTAEYYAKQSVEFLKDHSQIQYIDNLSQRVNEEQQRALKHNASELTKSVVEALITSQVERISQGFMEFVEKRMMDCIKKQISLILRTGNVSNLMPLVDLLKTKIISEGESKMRSLTPDAPMKDPGAYVTKLAELHSEYIAVVKDGTQNHPSFEQAMSEALIHVVNLPIGDAADVGEAAGFKKQGVSRTAEILARYCDMLLRRGNKTIASDEDLEKALTDFTTVFKYLADKDGFKTFYQKHLARRLINNQHTTIDRESHVLGLLKNSESQEYTRHMENMLRDFQQSSDVSREFADTAAYRELRQARGIAFEINVLSSNSWPYACQDHPFVPPEELQLYMGKFFDFYRSKNASKKLTWLHQHSKIQGLQQQYDISQCTCHQASILVLFNNGKEWTVKEICDTLKLNLAEIKGQLACKLLLMVGAPAPEPAPAGEGPVRRPAFNQELITDEAKIIVNSKFVSKKFNFSFAKPGAQETKEDVQKAYSDVRREKGFWIDAAVVRIMKARQRLTFNELTQEVMRQAVGRFPVNRDAVKKQCEGLVDKEYLKRDETDKNVFIYIA